MRNRIVSYGKNRSKITARYFSLVVPKIYNVSPSRSKLQLIELAKEQAGTIGKPEKLRPVGVKRSELDFVRQEALKQVPTKGVLVQPGAIKTELIKPEPATQESTE